MGLSTHKSVGEFHTLTPRKSPFLPVVYNSSVDGANCPTLASLPEKVRCVFPYLKFNEIQSKTFESAFLQDSNLVISAPAGSGKTAVFELAILKLFLQGEKFQCVYLAPTKALCSERYNDWYKRFRPLNITVGLMTNDIDFAEMRKAKRSNVIVTTPEKWDLETRKCNDFKNFVRLLLIDEAHVIKDLRGSTLEVVVTRMKNAGFPLRIIALSATILNIKDISLWIQNGPDLRKLAETFIFDDPYWSSVLDKKVISYKMPSDNIFLFDNMLNSQLNKIILEYGDGKPVIIFCPTRNSAKMTAMFLAKKSSIQPSTRLKVKDKELQNVCGSKVAFHHAGLVFLDRTIVENAYLNGRINILCSTSSLFVGINLPAFLVIIKGTKCWAQGDLVDYPESEIIQMIGRAGRPPFESIGRAIILTSFSDKAKYENLVLGSQKVESCLHTNIHDHLVAEVALGVIKSHDHAVRWLKSTFLYVRFTQNPAYYSSIPQTSEGVNNFTQRLAIFGQRAILDLSENNLISGENDAFQVTNFGKSMVKHYVSFGTMKQFLRVSTSSTVQDCLVLLAKSFEFLDAHLKHNERRLYQSINSSPSMKFPVDNTRFLDSDKVSILIQFELGGIEYPTYKGSCQLHSPFINDKLLVFKQALRICRCLIEVLVSKGDAISLMSCLYLNRCIQGKAWEDTPMELRQVHDIGPKYSQKLVERDIDRLIHAKGLQLLQIMKYLAVKALTGKKILEELSNIPFINLEITTSDSERKCINAHIKVELMGSHPSFSWRNRCIILNIVTTTNDGMLIDFRKIPASRYSFDFDLVFSPNLKSRSLECQVSADNIAGVLISKILRIFSDSQPSKEYCVGLETWNKSPQTGIAESQDDNGAGFNISKLDVFNKGVEKDSEISSKGCQVWSANKRLQNNAIGSSSPAVKRPKFSGSQDSNSCSFNSSLEEESVWDTLNLARFVRGMRE